MKLFNIEEANALLPRVRGIVESISKSYGRLLAFRDAAQHAAEGAELGGGAMAGGAAYVSLLTKLGKATSELEALGVQLKDYERGLIDFPSMRDGRIILLCWQIGEGDEVSWWHDVESGFAGRQPL